MGKKKLERCWGERGCILQVTTVGRMLKKKPQCFTSNADSEASTQGRVVTAKHSNNVWHIDLTVVPTGRFWTPWFPFSLPQCWPFAWWAGVIVDHFSRRVMGITAFKSQPTSEAIRAFLGRTIAKANRTPKYIICDRGKQFDCPGFRQWCERTGIKPPRYGAIGHHGSIAVVERAILAMKCLLARLLFVPYRRKGICAGTHGGRRLAQRASPPFVAWRPDAQRADQGIPGKSSAKV